MDFPKIRKAVFPVAGLGTRFLPATKSIPKEMLTVVDRPVIQHVVDEARAAGIEHFVFVTGRNKTAIEDHFDKQYELEHTLKIKNKHAAVQKLQDSLLAPGQVSYTRQQEPLGLGHAIWCARHIIGNEPFAVVLPDMIMHSQRGCLSELIGSYQQFGGNIIAVEEVAPEETHKYGVVGFSEHSGDGYKISHMVEKPPQGSAPSNLIISGRYILQPEIFDYLGKAQAGAGGEIQLTDSMAEMLKVQDFHAVQYKGQVFDCGSKLGFLAANIAFGLNDPEIGEEFLRISRTLFSEYEI